MAHYLVVANQTLNSDELWAEIHKRLKADADASFFVVVPNTAAIHYHIVPAAGGFVPMPSLITTAVPDTDEEATARAQQELEALLERIRPHARADGVLGDPDPYEAIRSTVETADFEEIILATLPGRNSRWLRMDVPSKVERNLKLPVTTVTAHI
ncbi:MAG TPA: hypothetical protein VFP89_00930 [Propionibacteriaceae bacterium]|nr:hypothetical protein [Propionibacteriaceae bacterium]